MTYRSLDAGQIVATADALQRRIAERFPDSGLNRVALELHAIATGTEARIHELRRPRRGLRLATGALTLLILAVAVMAVSRLRLPNSVSHLGEFVTVAALYAQQLDDAVVLAAVSELETLAAGLAGKIWQKLVILGSAPQHAVSPLSPTPKESSTSA